MKLSKNFSLWELTKSQTASRRGIKNSPTKEHLQNLITTANKILQPVRDHYGIPFTPSSGYRSPALNRAVGGSKDSQHSKGEAVDFEVPGISNYDLATWIKKNIEFDQLILEFYTPGGDPNSGWVHCSYREGSNRKELLTAYKVKTRWGKKTVYKPGLLR